MATYLNTQFWKYGCVVFVSMIVAAVFIKLFAITA